MSNERSNRMRSVSINYSSSGSNMNVDTPKLLNNIENSKIRAYQNPIQEEKRPEISNEDQQSSPEDEIESMKKNK